MSSVSSSLLRAFLRFPRSFISTSIPYNGKEMTVREALNSALDEEIANDKNVFILGEEVALYDGAYKITKGLYNKHGDPRVVDTPITEMGFTGLAVGAALGGLRPVCEFMTMNFALQAMDHIINSAAKGSYMSGGIMKCPIVFRGANGSPGAVGAQHSQCFSSWYMNVPGLIVLYPYDCEDARGLLKAAVRDPNPVVFLESEALYSKSFYVSDEALSENFILPIGKAKIAREGDSVTIVTFERGVGISLDAAEELKAQYGIECEVINLRSLRPLDLNTIINSVNKTNRLITVENGWHTCGVGSEISAAITESESFYNLDSPILRITGADVPTPYAFNLEPLAFPTSNDVVNAVKKSLLVFF